ncbi:GIY-YIG nuclease family protein [Sporomusa paucivorans]|uniref:GIY-YIG nuclease family protein n=1 Tax=Sporomusa paucivorans TaxID=2376 RepID=UPI003570AD24
MVPSDSNYFWVRVFDYDFERDDYDKGIMLDEFYLKDLEGGREEAKQAVREKYSGKAQKDIGFAKPKKQKNGLYAIVMESSKFFYDRFCKTIETYCFACHKPISGKASEFPRAYLDSDGDDEEAVYFCNYDCKRDYHDKINPFSEGEFQVKEEGAHGDIFGYIYLIYNKAENVYYVGQTRFMPFFRWQEHVKDGAKGDIKDLSFSVLTEVRRSRKQNDEFNQAYLNSVEAWWIAKFSEEGNQVFNITKPKITVEHLKELFNEMVIKQQVLINSEAV